MNEPAQEIGEAPDGIPGGEVAREVGEPIYEAGALADVLEEYRLEQAAADRATE